RWTAGASPPTRRPAHTLPATPAHRQSAASWTCRASWRPPSKSRRCPAAIRPAKASSGPKIAARRAVPNPPGLWPRLACGESPLVLSALHRRVYRHWIPMSKTLIIAEKPSVALDISRALGGFAREGDYFESERYVRASSIGHLL